MTLKARCYTKTDDVHWNVALFNTDDRRLYWLKISLNEQSLQPEWEQTTFCINNYDDLERQIFQEDADNLAYATDVAAAYLVIVGELIMDTDGNWFVTE